MFKKKQSTVEAVWPLQAEYDKQVRILNGNTWTMEDYNKQLAVVLALEDKRAAWEEAHKPPEKRRVSPDGWLAAAVTAVVGVAPYAIEKGGHLASHLKTKVQTPKLWK